ncbi:hypothetical protein FNV43_RR04555 [Rhamnella rubrinervis]|uniref:Uncharacterized protein n=1 Tax=Rhamnella rubrinervis TaxID=2594499 RepID=A0A8K0HM60_9ROSA|nr:hypothetical protein FNV43_RR04555 [Rhamnella rubrinervis]
MYWWYLDQLDDDRLRIVHRLEYVFFGYELQEGNEEESMEAPINEEEDEEDPSNEDEKDESPMTTLRPPNYEYLSE